MNCTHCNVIQTHNRDGAKSEILRCSHRQCPLFAKEISADDCAKCEFFAEPKKEPPPPPKRQRRALGDWVEDVLTKVGVTEDRYLEAKAFLTLRRKDEVTCRCRRRKLWLNKVEQDLRSFLTKKRQVG